MVGGMKVRKLVIVIGLGLLAAEIVRRYRRRSTDPVLRTDLSRVVSKYIGETERNLRRLSTAQRRVSGSCSSTRRTICSATEPEWLGGACLEPVALTRDWEPVCRHRPRQPEQRL